MRLHIEIDNNSGFCFGVIRAIQKAETELKKHSVYSLGDLVHNEQEMARLRQLGLQTTTHNNLKQMQHCRILFRAHGEPPETYRLAIQNDNELIDATCPVVLALQKKIRTTYLANRDNAQIVLLGKAGHAEVIGLQGQTDNTAIVIQNVQELNKIDVSKPIFLFSQTTTSPSLLQEVVAAIKNKTGDAVSFVWEDTICRHVVNRVKHLADFASSNDYIFFVGGQKSSNAKYLYEQCKSINSESFFISDGDDLLHQTTLFTHIAKRAATNDVHIGICGATSTPLWLMKEIQDEIYKLVNL